MATKLKAIVPKEAREGKAKILIYGDSGVGKTWASLEFPKPYYIDVEDGASKKQYIEKLHDNGGMYLGIDQGSQDFDGVLEQVRALATEKHGFKTVVLDSITKLYNLEIARENERLLLAGKKDEFGSSKKPATRYMQRLVAWLQRMDMNCVLIAHGKALWEKDDKGERSENGKTFDCWEKLIYELDLTLEVFMVGAKRFARVKKTRLEGFKKDEVFSWDYQEFAKRYGKDLIDAEVKEVKLVSEDKLTMLFGLLEQKKITEETRNKQLSSFGISSFDELEEEKADKLINHLKEMKGE